MRRNILIRSVVLLLLIPAGPRSQPRRPRPDAAPARITVSQSPAGIVNGSPALFRVDASPPLRALTGQFQGRRIFFRFDASVGAWYGFGGVGIDAPAGPSSLTLECTLLTGTRFFSSHPITIGRAPDRSVQLTVPEIFTRPDAGALARIRKEKAVKAAAFRRASPERLWTGRFASPVRDIVTEPFGVQRLFNGVRQSVHQGLDYRAALGTEVEAMNDGRVLLAREMFYEGGFLVLDHGQGLLTLYLHLSRIDVREGDRVAKRQIVARSGDTGRATGPHLHVGVRWQGIYLDPETLLRMELP